MKILTATARAYLAARAVKPATIAKAKLRSLTATETTGMFRNRRWQFESLYIPYGDEYGVARLFGCTTAKFVCPWGEPMQLYVPPLPPGTTLTHFQKDTALPLVVIEGPIKALAVAGLSIACVGTNGCRLGDETLRQLEEFDLRGRVFSFITDADTGDNPDVARGWLALSTWASNRGAVVQYVPIPANGDTKRGIDDWIAQTKATRRSFLALTRHPIDSPVVDELRATVCRWDEAGNADRLIFRNPELRHHYDSNAWYSFDGKRYVIGGGAVQELAKSSASDLYVEAKLEHNDNRKAALLRHAKQSSSARAIKAAIELARSAQRVRVELGELDADPWLLGVANGVLDLQSGKLYDHAPAYLITKWAGTTFDPRARAPRWQEFLQRVTGNDVDTQRYLQRIAGYALTGLTIERKVFFVYGNGANGKSVFLETLHQLLGDYAGASRAELLMRSTKESDPERSTPFLAALRDLRFVRVSEIDEGHALNEALLKDLTGGDQIAARKNYGDPVDFKPRMKIFIAGNHRPAVYGTDEAIWDRLVLIPFNVRIPEAERDPQLQSKLAVELPGILAWAMEGCLAWRRDGLQPSQKIVEAVAAYRIEQDHIQTWLDECTRKQLGAKVRTSGVYSCYSDWAKSNGLRPLSAKRFKGRMEEKGFTYHHSGAPWFLDLVLVINEVEFGNPPSGSNVTPIEQARGRKKQ